MTEHEVTVNKSKIRLLRGDITREEVDAIVNAANSSLLGGGGVDGAIHRAGGPQILRECQEIRDQRGKCAPGDAVITSGGKLPARHVVHTVGPIWRGGSALEAETLANAYRNSLMRAEEVNARTIAFPSISTGAYGYPVDQAAKVAIHAVLDYCKVRDQFAEIRFVLFDDRTFEAYDQALREVSL